MKIAYLILAHKDPKHICRLANKLTESSWSNVFIHVDKKIDINPFHNLLRNNHSVHFIEPIEIYWGGYSAVKATIAFFKQALEHDSYDRFVILQGLDYPIRSNQEIYDFFKEHPNTEFIKAINSTEDKRIKVQHKYSFYWFLDNPNPLKKIWNQINGQLLKSKLLIKFKKPFIIENGKKYSIYEGWAHVALTRKCVEYIVKFHDTHPKFNKFFITAYAPDESYFHTIVYNSDFLNYTVDGKSIEFNGNSSMLNVTYFEYPHFVKIFKDKSDFELLYNSNYLFFRKASSESKDLLDYIDDYHKQNTKHTNAY